MRRLLTSLTLAGSILVMWLAYAGPTAGQDPSADTGPWPDPATIATYDAQCAPCHGSDGEGGVGPALTSSVLTAAERRQVIAQGRGEMPSFSGLLGADEIDDLALMMDYLAAAETYATQCAPCHGAAGRGGIGPSLVTSRRSAEDRLQIVTNGAGAMPAFGPTLDEGQLQAVVDFVAGFTSAVRGGEVIFEIQCAPCHGAVGEGGVGPDIRTSTLPADGLIALISHGAGRMPTFGGTLSTTEIEAVATYALSLRSPEPAGGGVPDDVRSAEIFAEQCAGCHGGDASGGVGPNLLDSSLAIEAEASVISQGRGSMPAFADILGDEEIDALAHWLAALGASGGDTDRLALLGVGAKLYTANCAGCHGVDESGDTGPALNKTSLMADEVALVITSGRGTMPSFGETLSTDDIATLATFIEAATEAAVSFEAPGPAAVSGQAVFIGSCATCHGVDGGGGSAPSLTAGKLTANEIISRVYGGHAQGMPAFEGVLTATEVQAVARYLLELPKTESGGIPLGTVALVGGLMIVLVLGGLWATGRLGSPPVADDDLTYAGDASWQEPLPPGDDEPDPENR